MGLPQRAVNQWEGTPTLIIDPYSPVIQTSSVCGQPEVEPMIGAESLPIYNLRHVFCTRLSGVAPDAVVQRAMRHTSPETKRHYQLGMADQVRQAMEKSNKKTYERGRLLHFYDSGSGA
jgi:integrase